jgi:hypothetical protein
VLVSQPCARTCGNGAGVDVAYHVKANDLATNAEKKKLKRGSQLQGVVHNSSHNFGLAKPLIVQGLWHVLASFRWQAEFLTTVLTQRDAFLRVQFDVCAESVPGHPPMTWFEYHTNLQLPRHPPLSQIGMAAAIRRGGLLAVDLALRLARHSPLQSRVPSHKVSKKKSERRVSLLRKLIPLKRRTVRQGRAKEAS